MAYLLKLVYFNSTKASFFEKTSKKSEYLVRALIKALFYFKAAIQVV